MGNCLGNPDNSTHTTRPSSPGTSKNYSNNRQLSSSGGTNFSSVGGGTVSSSSVSTSGGGGGIGTEEADFPDGRILSTPDLRVFCFAELRNATNNFKNENVLGEEGFGRVYKGYVDEKTTKSGSTFAVAIKKLNPESMQGLEEWEDTAGKKKSFTWFMNTCQEETWKTNYSERYNAKLSDFGLAKHGPMGGESHVTTRVMGTYGYAAPEYVATGHLYVKSDVYGFGVVLLEMLTGQRAVDTNRPIVQHNLVDMARPNLSNRRKLVKIMDARLEDQYPVKGALQAAALALNCLEQHPKNRPSMKEVVKTLEQIQAIKEKPRGP